MTNRNWFSAGFWLALGVIFLHALTPSATPWRVSDGSAFNGFTRDVSLGPRHATPPEKEQRVRERRVDQAGMHAPGSAVAVVPSLATTPSAPPLLSEAIAPGPQPDVTPAPILRQRARDPPTA